MVLEDQAMVALVPWGWDKLGLIVENGVKQNSHLIAAGRKEKGKEDKNEDQEEKERARKQKRKKMPFQSMSSPSSILTLSH